MSSKKRSPSLRLSVFLTLGVSLTVFLTFFYLISKSTMSRLVIDSEIRFMGEQLNIVSGLLSREVEEKERTVYSIALRDETIALIKGGGSENLSEKHYGLSSPELSSLSIISYADSEGNEIFTEERETSPGAGRGATEGIFAHFSELCKKLRGSLGTGSDPFFSGITTYNGMPYYVYAALVFDDPDGGDDVVGSVIAAVELSGRYFQNLTRLGGTEFYLSPYPDNLGSQEFAISGLGDKYIEASLPLLDVSGRNLRLTLTTPRTSYQEGMAQISVSLMVIVTLMVLFAGAIYLIFEIRILNPLGRLAEDIEKGTAGVEIPSAGYSKSREFEVLCEAINDMTSRLNESTVSLEAVDAILNGIDALIYVTDSDTHEILFANNQFMEIFGADGGGVIGEKCYEVIQDGHRELCADCPVGRMHEGISEKWEIQNERRGRLYRESGRLIKWMGGKTAHLGYAADITDERATAQSMEKRLNQQEIMSAITQSFTSSADTDVLIANALRVTGEFLDASKILTATLNRKTGDLDISGEWYNPRQNVLRLEAKAFPFKRGDAMFDAFIRENKSYLAYDNIDNIDEFKAFALNGVKSFISIPVYATGAFWGIISIDVCNRYHTWDESDIHLVRLIGSVISGVVTRRSTEESLLRMSSIVNSSPQFIAYIHGDGEFQYMNHGVVDISGYDTETLIESGISLLFDGEAREEFFGRSIPEIFEKKRAAFETPIRRGDGEERILRMSAFTTESGGGIAIIASDITEERKLEYALVEAKEQAEQSSRAKGDFLSRMSHEMRTPMNAIIGMTAIARSSEDVERKAYCLDKIDEASQHLLGVINDILDMSKIEASKFELNYTEFDFEKMLQKVTNVVNFRVDEKEQAFIIDLDGNMPKTIISDEQRLSQVLTNLLSNAVKFTPERGTVWLRASVTGQSNGMTDIRMEVSDTGIGISAEQQQRLFRSFEQADGGISRRFGGTGLGLAISKSIIDMMGGTIEVESEPGKGTSFYFTITVETGDSAGARTRVDLSQSELRILVVDDSEDVLRYFKAFCDGIMISCEVASDGAQAEAILKEAPDRSFSMIFVDWHLPNMNGIELMKEIGEKAGGGTVVLMISALLWPEVQEEASKAGITRFIRKPLFASDIMDCVNEVLGNVRRASGPAAGYSEGLDRKGIFKGRRILLAEDIEINREIVISLLEETGLEIDSAADGREVVDMFVRDPHSYELIFMDIHMPDVDGYEATRCIRALDDDWAREIPICAMTANVFSEDVERCRAAGMNDHIGKPVDFNEIIEVLEKYLK